MTKQSQEQKENVVSGGVSLRPSQRVGLAHIAFREGHMSRSRVVQRWVDEGLSRELGDNWEQLVKTESERAA